MHTHSYYLVFVVDTDQVPDTSKITLNDLQGAYVAVANNVPTSTSSFNVPLGTGISGTFTTPDGIEVLYTDAPLKAGVTYYFFIRLYSSVVSNCHIISVLYGLCVICLIQDTKVFNDSVPKTPSITSMYTLHWYITNLMVSCCSL